MVRREEGFDAHRLHAHDRTGRTEGPGRIRRRGGKGGDRQALSDGRFTLGLGAGENLNEHVVGRGWPSANVRHDLLAEAVQIIGGLFDGGYFNYAGDHFRVDSAKWDLPEQRVPIAVEPNAALSREWDATKPGSPARKIAAAPAVLGRGPRCRRPACA